MPTIKITSNGLIITKDGRPSCTCCCVHVDCLGLWGPGYDSLPEEIYVENLTGVVLVDQNMVHYRSFGGKCQWHTPSHNSQVAFDGAYSEGGSTNCMWTVNAHEEFPGPTWIGYKKGQFTDGPTGDYRANPDGLTGAIYFLVDPV